MKQTRRALAFTLALVMLLTVATEGAYAGYDYYGPDTVWEDNVGSYSIATKADTKNFYKSMAIGMVAAPLLDAVGEKDEYADSLEEIAELVYTAIMENDGSKSLGLGIMGNGLMGAVKRCYLNNKPVDKTVTAAGMMLDELVSDSAVAALGLGVMGAALMDAEGEVGKIFPYQDENDTSAGLKFNDSVEIVRSAFSERGIANSAAKCNALGTMGQGLVGALKRRVLNNKPVEDFLTPTAFFVGAIRDDSSTAAPAIGKMGAACMDTVGEAGHFEEVRDGIKPVMDAFADESVANSWDKCAGLAILGQSEIGTLKRCYINTRDTEGVCSVAAVMAPKIEGSSAKAAQGLGMIGAAMLDSVGETGHFDETYAYLEPLIDKFGEAAIAGSKDKCYALGILGQAEIGGIKRRYINSQPVCELTTNVAIWIADQIEGNREAAALPLGKIGAAIMNTGSETDKFAELKDHLEPIVAAFAENSVAKSEDRCMGLGALGSALAGSMKKYYLSAWDMSDPSRLDAATSVAGVMMDKIKSSDRKAAPALGKIGAALVDAVMETETGQETVCAEAADWILAAIDANDAAKSEGIGIVGEKLLLAIQRNPALAYDLCSEAGIIIDAIAVNTADKSVALGRLGETLIECVIDKPAAKDAINTGAAIIIDTIAECDAAKALTVLTVSDGENVEEKEWGISVLGGKLLEEISGTPGDIEYFCTAAGLFADAIENVPVSKGESVCYVAGKLFFYIGPSTAEILCSDAALVFNAIDANTAAKSAGIANLGGGFLGSRQRAVLNAKDETILIEPFNTVLGYIEQIDEKNTYSKGGSGAKDYAEEVLPEAEHEPISDEELLERFTDLVPGAWYFEGVRYVASHDIMKGTDKGFEPNAKASRAQIAQLLMNLDGTKPSGKTVALGDVHAGDWFAEAVTWIIEKGIAKGQGLNFGVNGSITREDLAVLLYNYARFKGYDVSARGSVDGFSDVANMKDYAREALQWAVGVGLIQGTTDAKGNTILDPLGNATRGQFAIIMHRFCETVAKQPTATQNAK